MLSYLFIYLFYFICVTALISWGWIEKNDDLKKPDRSSEIKSIALSRIDMVTFKSRLLTDLAEYMNNCCNYFIKICESAHTDSEKIKIVVVLLSAGNFKNSVHCLDFQRKRMFLAL